MGSMPARRKSSLVVIQQHLKLSHSLIRRGLLSISLVDGCSAIEGVPFQTIGSMGGSLLLLTSNANVGAGAPRHVTFAVPKACFVASVGFSVIMFNLRPPIAA